jgi:hypothetical protein
VHPPGLLLRSNGFLEDGAVAAAAKAAAAALVAKGLGRGRLRWQSSPNPLKSSTSAL